MITQKGLTAKDIFALISEDGTEVSINIRFAECEKFTMVKNYPSRAECNAQVQGDIDAFMASHKNTTFTVSATEEEVLEEAVVNDSWGAIFNDAKDGLKSRFRR